MRNVFEEIENSESVNKARERMEQSKARYADTVRAANKRKRTIETHHKIVMGGIVAKFFPECYNFEEQELLKVLDAALKTADFKRAVDEVKRNADKDNAKRPFTQGRGQNESEGENGEGEDE